MIMLSSLWNSSSDKQIGSDWFHSIALTLTKIFPLKWMAKRLKLISINFFWSWDR